MRLQIQSTLSLTIKPGVVTNLNEAGESQMQMQSNSSMVYREDEHNKRVCLISIDGMRKGEKDRLLSDV